MWTDIRVCDPGVGTAWHNAMTSLCAAMHRAFYTERCHSTPSRSQAIWSLSIQSISDLAGSMHHLDVLNTSRALVCTLMPSRVGDTVETNLGSVSLEPCRIIVPFGDLRRAVVVWQEMSENYEERYARRSTSHDSFTAFSCSIFRLGPACMPKQPCVSPHFQPDPRPRKGTQH